MSAPEVDGVLGGHEDEAVERGDLLGPGLGVRLSYSPERGHGLVEVRQIEVGEVDELELGLASLCVLQHPLRDLSPTRPGRVLPMMIPILTGERVPSFPMK